MKGKQTCVLCVTHAVKIKINLLLLSGDGLSAMSVDTGKIMKTRLPAVKVHHREARTHTHTQKHAINVGFMSGRSCFSHNLCDLHLTSLSHQSLRDQSASLFVTAVQMFSIYHRSHHKERWIFFFVCEKIKRWDHESCLSSLVWTRLEKLCCIFYVLVCLHSHCTMTNDRQSAKEKSTCRTW